MKRLKRFLLIPLASLFGLSVMVAGDNGISAHADNYTANWGTHELVQQSDYDLRDGATESQFISYGPSAVGKVWYSRSVANYYDLDKVTVLTSYAGYDSLLKQGTYSASTVKDQIDYVTENLGYDVIGGINGSAFNTANGAPNMGLMINGVEYCPGNYFSHGFFGILKHEETGHQRAVIGRSSEYAGFRDGTTTSRVENGVTVDYTGYKLWQAIGAWYDAILIEDGQICGPETWNEEHPRTAIGITADGDVVTYVVEGRNGNRAGGMSLYNMATVMKELGCVYAVNLDGGGSSTALSKHAGENFYRNGIQGAYGADRSVGDAILFVSTESMTDTGTEEPDTTFNKAHILPNNELFVVGTTIEFEATGSNAYGDPVALPEGLVWELDETKSTANIGTIDPETGVFTANGTTSGNVYVNLKDGETIVGSTKVDLAWPDWSYSEAFSTNFTLGLGETKELPFTLYPGANEGNKALGISTWRPMNVQENDLEWNVPNGCSMKVNEEGTFYLQAGQVPVIDGKVSIKQVKATGQTNIMTKVATVSIGKAPTLLYDFEDTEWLNQWAAGGNSQSKKMYKTTDPNEVLFGSGAMAIDYDMSNGNYIGGMDPNKLNNRTVTFYNDKQGFTPVIPADAKYVGMWVFFPEGLDGCWFRITLQGYKTDGSGNLATAATTMSDFVSMPKNPKVDMGIQGSGEWRFYYTEIGWDTRYGKAWEGIQGPYGFYSCQVMWSAFADTALGYDYNQPDGNTPEEIAANKEIARQKVEESFEKAKIGTILVDNVMALYGAPTKDMLNPYYDNINVTENEDKYSLSLNLKDEDRFDSDKAAALKYQESTTLGQLQSTSGLDYSTLEVYLNGELLSSDKYTVNQETGLLTINEVESLVAGTTVRVVILDQFTNKLDRTSTLRSLTIKSGEDGEVQETHLFWDREAITGLELPEPNERAGHHFVGWDKDIPSVMPNSDVVITAQYEPNLHNVIINDANGVPVAFYENVPFGSTIQLPTVEGYTYSWAEGVSNIMPDNDVTLTVNKTVNTHTYKVIYNGETLLEETVNYNSLLTLPSVAGKSKEGHTFIGWDRIVTRMPDSDVTINAVFSVNNYPVTIKYDEDVVATLSLPYGSTIALPELETVGYSYAWAEGANTVVPAQAHTVQVVKVINKHTVTINDQNGTLIKTLENVEFGSTIALPEAPEGYTFAWAEGTVTVLPDNDVTLVVNVTVNEYNLVIKDALSNVYFEGNVAYGSEIKLPEEVGYTFAWDEAEVPATMPASAKELLVTKTINKHTVTINDQNGTLIKTLENVEFNSTIALPEAPEGYTFAWAEGTVTVLPDNDVTLVVNVTVNEYNLVIKDALSNVYFEGNVAYGSEIKLPAEVGYTFAWVEEEVPATMPASAKELLVIRTANVHKFTVVYDEETIVDEDVAFGTTLNLPDHSSYSKVGHTFAGWDVEVPATMPDADVVVTAKFTVNKYTVQVVDENGTLYAYLLQDYNTVIALPEIEGYKVTWKDGIEEKLVPVDGGIFEIETEINSHTLTFIVDGEVFSSSTLEYNASIVYPNYSTIVNSKVGYTFIGWDKVISNMPDSEVTITAVFVANKHDVTFVDADGNVVAEAKDVAYGSEIALPVKEGYTITWAEGTENVTMPNNDVELTVVVTTNKYKLTFVFNGEEIVSEDVEYGAAIAAPSLEGHAKEGYTFLRWDAVIPATMPANELTFTAEFVINRVTVTFVDQNGEVLSEIVDVRYGDPISLPTELGYEIKWPEGVEAVTTAPGVDTVYTLDKIAHFHKLIIVDQDGEEVEVHEEVAYESEIALPVKEGYTITWAEGVVPVMPNEDTTLRVNVVANKYKVSFYFGEILLSSEEVAYGEVINVPSTKDYYKEGYTFVGWDDEIPELMIADELEFHAEFVINSYQAVIINVQDNIVVKFLLDVEYGSKIDLPTQEGYTYAWAEDETGIMPDHDALLYVTKTINTHDVTINDSEGNLVAKYESVAYGSTIELPVVDGYVVSWAEGVVPVMPDHDVTLVVNKVNNVFQLTFKFDGKVVSSQTLKYGDEVDVPSLEGFTKEGYAFVGWDIKVPATMPAKNVEINAVFEICKYTITVVDQNGNLVAKYENLPFGATVELPTVENYLISWKNENSNIVPAKDATIEVVKVLDVEKFEELADAVINASTIEDKFAAVKAWNEFISLFDESELTDADISSLIRDVKAVIDTHNSRVDTLEKDLNNARTLANWVIYGLSIVSVAAVAFVAKRRIF
ncbi:MAG: hypothetical protein E7180_01830 [Erysipelotrichaceae bacterium]|nr:hypothetical protein [Erysipelotrichaceae bacterium]